MEEEFEVFLRLSSGNRLSLRGGGLSGASTVLDAKRAIAALVPDAPVPHQRVIFKGRILDDDAKSLSQCGVVRQSTLFLVVSRSTGGGTSEPSTSNNPIAATSSSHGRAATTGSEALPSSARSDRLHQLIQPQPNGPGAMTHQPTAPSLFPSTLQSSAQGSAGQGSPFGVSSSRGSGSTNGDAGPGSLEQLAQRLLGDMDPDFIANMMHSQLESNPALRRLMDENPHLRHMMTDPGALRQAAQLMRNPEMMQQAMRQQDLALSQIENMPGGFATLSSMYRNMQVPLEESLMSGRQSGADSSSSSSPSSAEPSRRSDEGAAGTAMPNPWGSSSSSSANRTSQGGSGRSSRPPMAMSNPFLQSLRSAPGMASSSPPPTQPPDSAYNPWANLGGSGSSGSGGSSSAPGSAGPNPPSGGGSEPLPNFGVPAGTPPWTTMPRLDDPLVQSALALAREHPELFRAALQSSPMYRSEDPATVERAARAALDPAFLQWMARFGEQMGDGGRASASGAGSMPGYPPFVGVPAPSPGGAAGSGAPAGLDFLALLRNAATEGAIPNSSHPNGFPSHQAPPPSASPRERFRRQLRQLAEMGFDREDSCLAALQAEHGNLNRAVDRLLSGPAEPPAQVPVPTQAPPESPSSSAAGTSFADPELPPAEGATAEELPPAPPKDASDKKND